MSVLQKLKIGILALVLVGISGGALAAPGAGSARQGVRLYSQEKFTEALDAFEQALEKDPQSPQLNFNAGTAAFRVGQFADAAGYFRKALLTDDDSFRSQAAYNLGNALFMEAQSLTARPEEARSKFEDALRHLSGIPADHPVAPDARHNARIVQQALDALAPPPSGQDASEDQDSGDSPEDNEADSGKTCPLGKPSSSQDSSGESSEESSQGPSAEQDTSASPEDAPGEDKGEEAANQQSTAGASGDQSEDGASSEQDRDASAADQLDDTSADTGAGADSESEEESPAQDEPTGSAQTSASPEDSAAAENSEGTRVITDSVAFTPEEARILLNMFQEREPGGLLNFYRGSGAADTGYQDW